MKPPFPVSAAKPATLATLQATLAALAVKPVHLERVFRNWLAGRPLTERASAERAYPAALLAALPDFARTLAALATVEAEFPSPDGAVRILLRLADGQKVECVLLPKDGVCISTQVGCAVGCTFCETGRHGLLRQLTDAEILAQVALARARRPVKRVLCMGMGEPAHNLDAVLSALATLGKLGGIGHKQMVISSVGDPRLFARLKTAPLRPALALSLHSSVAAKRARLLPHAPALTPAELVAAGQDYAKFAGHPIQYQWTLLPGVNDGDDELAGLVRLLSGQYAMLNLIVENRQGNQASGESDAACGEEEAKTPRIVAMTRALNRAGILTRIRRSAGQAVQGGCGQLWAKSGGSVRATGA